MYNKLSTLGIESIYHFTDKRNIDGIKKKTGLLCYYKLCSIEYSCKC